MNHEEYHQYETFNEQFKTITSNLWYTWDPGAQKIVDVLLNKHNYDKSSFQRFNELTEEQQQELFRNTHLRASVDHVYRDLQDYLSHTTWFDDQLEKNPEYNAFIERPIAFLCAEYGFTEWLNIYSGGLGILAGDMLKEASDLGIPMVGVGLLYQFGFFKQYLSDSGYQTEEYLPLNPDTLPLTPVRISTGAPLMIEVTMIDHPVYCKIWQLQVGRVPLFLLDTNIPENVRQEDKLITGHLYGGDQDTRIRQEIILGIGGERALSALGYHPTIFSMNEGHSAFAALEITKHFMFERSLSFAKAKEETRTKMIYTNHTVVPAGNDVFPVDLITKYLQPYLLGLGITFDELVSLGNKSAHKDTFSMPELAFEMSMMANAVSHQHGDVISQMYPDRTIIPITNGVHLPTWVHAKMHHLYEKYISPDWQISSEDEVIWENVYKIPDLELWGSHMLVKQQMIDYLNEHYNTTFNPQTLTITWARRFATYKRADMFMEDLDRLIRLVSNDERPVQIIIGGKAHPKDSEGKNIISRIVSTIKDSRFKNRIVFIPNYEISLARRLVSGSDVWLNNPIEKAEASGTSGMKASANGVLQCTTKEGWTAEVDWNDAGFIIDQDSPSSHFYDQLEYHMLPMYYERDQNNVPVRWVSNMKHTINKICPHFSTKRTLIDYFEKLYISALHKQH